MPQGSAVATSVSLRLPAASPATWAGDVVNVDALGDRPYHRPIDMKGIKL